MSRIVKAITLLLGCMILGGCSMGQAAGESAAQESATQDSATQEGETKDSEAQDSAAQDSTAQEGGTKDSEAQDGAAQDSAVQEGDAQDSEAQDSAALEGEDDLMTYMCPDGYQLRYDPTIVKSVELTEHIVQFEYTGECTDTNMVIVSYIPGRYPEEALYELTEPWGDQEKIERSEGFFPGTTDKWGYWRTFSASGEGSGLSETAIAGEYNGGVLIFDIVEHSGGDDENDMMVQDELASIVDSITYDNFGPQTMYSYYPGTYSSDNGKIILNEDHTGTLSFQDDVDIIWGTYELIASDDSFRYEFDIEGDSLNLDYDGKWIEFKK